jgi:hypothetical protein
MKEVPMKMFPVLAVLFVLVGCDTQSRRSHLPDGHPCASVSDDKYTECLERQESLKTLDTIDDRPNKPVPSASASAASPSATPSTTPSPAKPSDTPELPVFDPRPPPKVDPPFPPGVSFQAQPTAVTADFLPVGDNGCMPHQSLSIYNDSDRFMEVSGDDLRPCGDGNLVPIFVSQGNGSTRIARVIPPGERGTYYFYPWRSVLGQTVTTNGRKEYTIRVFDAGSIKGLTPETPAAQIIVMRDYVTTPFSENWWKRHVSDHKIAEAIAMK